MSDKKGDSPLKSFIYGIVGFNVVIGLLQRCVTFFTHDSFSKGFTNSAGSLIKLSGVIF